MTISTNTEALNATALATRAIHAGRNPTRPPEPWSPPST